MAYRIASAETFPSLGYMVKCGATTVWERWDGWTEERGFQDPAMNSFSHYAFGSIGKWFYESIGGVAAGAPGFRRVIVHPRLGLPIEHAATELKTMYGTVSCSWRRTQSGWEMELSIPANAFATVILPGPETATITESGTQLSDVEEIMSSRCEDGKIFLDVGSGNTSSVSPRSNLRKEGIGTVIGKNHLICGLLAVLILLTTVVGGSVRASTPYLGYTYDYFGRRVPSPQAYLPSRVIRGSHLGIGDFRNPADLFVSDRDFLYIVDTGNNRIVCIDRDLNVARVIDRLSNEGRADRFNRPGACSFQTMAASTS